MGSIPVFTLFLFCLPNLFLRVRQKKKAQAPYQSFILFPIPHKFQKVSLLHYQHLWIISILRKLEKSGKMSHFCLRHIWDRQICLQLEKSCTHNYILVVVQLCHLHILLWHLRMAQALQWNRKKNGGVRGRFLWRFRDSVRKINFELNIRLKFYIL